MSVAASSTRLLPVSTKDDQVQLDFENSANRCKRNLPCFIITSLGFSAVSIATIKIFQNTVESDTEEFNQEFNALVNQNTTAGIQAAINLRNAFHEHQHYFSTHVGPTIGLSFASTLAYMGYTLNIPELIEKEEHPKRMKIARFAVGVIGSATTVVGGIAVTAGAPAIGALGVGVGAVTILTGAISPKKLYSISQKTNECLGNMCSKVSSCFRYICGRSSQ